MGTVAKFTGDLATAKAQVEVVKATRPVLAADDGTFLAELTDSGDLRLNSATLSPKDALSVAQFILDIFKA